MKKNKTYRTIEEISEIFKITTTTIQSIINKNRIDCFANKGKLFINISDFYKIYTKKINPSLFDISNKKVLEKKKAYNILVELFKRGYTKENRIKIQNISLLNINSYNCILFK